MSLPSFTEISPAAQVALLHTLMYSGFRLPDRIGMNSVVMKNDKKLGGNQRERPGMQGCTCGKQALVRSPNRAKLD